jgi:hypothetical protein
MENGDICYSSWQGYDRRGVTHTPANQWWISCMNADGTNGRVELGAHGSPHIKTREYLMDWVDPARAAEGVTEFRAVRGIVDMGNGRAAFVNYYRGNQTGLFGIIFDYVRGDAEGATLLKNIAEGVKYQTANMPGSGRYVPSTIRAITPYANDQDALTRFHKDGRAAGKAGHPAPLPGDNWLYTHARGNCYEGTLQEQNNRKAMGGEPTCKKEIRRAMVPVVKNPFDPEQSVVIACASDEWNCWDGRAVADKSEIYGD